jgi:hypothetical protein
MPVYTISKVFNFTTSYYGIKDAKGKFVLVPGSKTRVKFWAEEMAAEYIRETLNGTVGETEWLGTAIGK